MDHEIHLSDAAEWFSQIGFMPHGHCYLWKPGLVWTHVVSDGLIGLSYVVIALLLYGLVRKIRLPFSGVFLAFGSFIAFCGLTHFMEIWNLWNADYWYGGFVKAITAVASVSTAFALLPVRPKVFALAQSADISEERKRKLEIAHKELNFLYEKAREADELKTRFFANVSHELRTPISLILGPAEELLKSGKGEAGSRRALEVIVRNSRTLLGHVNDLLDISKLEAGRLKPDYALVDLAKSLKITAAHFESAIQSKGISFSLRVPGHLDAEVDPSKMERVFMNLLSNALKFVPEGGKIDLSLESAGEKALVRISDTGPGISPDLHQAIFERFRQADERINRQYGGTGLGLAIVKDFVEMHGGSVRVDSQEGQGAAFTVEIPLKAPEGSKVGPKTELMDFSAKGDSAGNSSVSLEKVTGGLETAAGKPRILVCEDNPDMREYLAGILSPVAEVHLASDGNEGLAKARAMKPDLIVCDIMMPGMGGNELLAEVRSREELKNIPLLFLSARADDELRVSLLKEGGNDYLVKPFMAEELVARAGNLIRVKLAMDMLSGELNSKSDDLLELVREVSARKREASLARENADFARIEAEKAGKVRSTFLRLVSHELNTPLTAQHLTIQTLEKSSENFTERQKKMVERLLGASRQLRSLVDSLLEYTRLDSGKIPVNPVPVNLAALGEEICEELLPLVQKKGLKLCCELEQGLGDFQTDKKLLRVIVSNLMMNALKYTEEGSVTLKISMENGRGIFTVSDTGIGIEKSDLEKIFDPFEQLGSLNEKSSSGVGLGLAIVKQIVTALGGEISVETEPGQGSRFKIDLPPMK